ncbi:hypothetical protein [Haloferula sp. BvORR071]|uniref:hypothetical protein n=1 Tax=Haloferula sp. BvORR071 TaxID=1396141 RepID=UPI000553F6CE|nr:hypothetical protein [Haloferula sp. BvORR071]
MKSATSLISLLCLSSAALHAQSVPALMSYQGRVVDSSGTGIGTGTPTNRKMIFRLFDNATGGNRLWSEEQTVTLAGGDFSVILGQGVGASYNGVAESPRPSLLTVFGGTDRYLEIVVDNGDGNFTTADTAITPRQRLIATAFAVRAASADSVTSGSDLMLRDANHGLGWYGTGRLFNGINLDGPVLYGYSGGILGSVSGASQKAALRWDNAGRVSIGAGAAPTQALDVTGNARIDGAVMARGDSGFIFHTVGDADGGLFSPEDGVVTVKTNNAERLRVNANGVLPTVDVTGSIRLSGAGSAPPVTSELGGSGTRVVLFPGTASTVPFALGIDANTLWNSLPATSSYKWYGGTTEWMNLNGLTGTLKLNGGIEPKGIRLPSAFDVAATDFGGTAGNFISFAHSGISEDYIGYASNTFYFKDTPGGGDSTPPNINVGGSGTFGGLGSFGTGGSFGGPVVVNTGYRGGLAGEPGLVNFGINDSSTNRFGGSYTQGAQGGVIRVDARDTYDVFQFLARDKNSSSDIGVVASISAAGKMSLGGKKVTVGEDDFRIVRGVATGLQNGIVNVEYPSPLSSTLNLKGSGFKFLRISTGRYRIIFNTAFSDTPSFTFNPIQGVGVERTFAKITSISATSVDVELPNDEDAGRNDTAGLSFIAVGPR